MHILIPNCAYLFNCQNKAKEQKTSAFSMVRKAKILCSYFPLKDLLAWIGPRRQVRKTKNIVKKENSLLISSRKQQLLIRINTVDLSPILILHMQILKFVANPVLIQTINFSLIVLVFTRGNQLDRYSLIGCCFGNDQTHNYVNILPY